MPDSTPSTTCQICGRPIKAKTLRIAHHGYKRPQHHGYQTASCEGARCLPYELSCDQIARSIERRELYVAETTGRLAAHIASPSATLIYQPRNGYGDPKGAPITREIPAGFDPRNLGFDLNIRGSYAQLWEAQRYRLAAAIKGTEADLVYLRDRLASWRAPA